MSGSRIIDHQSKRQESQRLLVERLIKKQGNVTAAAATIGVDASTLWRWRDGSRLMSGPAAVAIAAVLKHPEDYAKYRELVRPAHRPPGT